MFTFSRMRGSLSWQISWHELSARLRRFSGSLSKSELFIFAIRAALRDIDSVAELD